MVTVDVVILSNVTSEVPLLYTTTYGATPSKEISTAELFP